MVRDPHPRHSENSRCFRVLQSNVSFSSKPFYISEVHFLCPWWQSQNGRVGSNPPAARANSGHCTSLAKPCLTDTPFAQGSSGLWTRPQQRGRGMFPTLETDNPGANLKPIYHICHPILVAFVWELTEETIHLPLGRLQGGMLSNEIEGRFDTGIPCS